jgi:hypothetical protein
MTINSRKLMATAFSGTIPIRFIRNIKAISLVPIPEMEMGSTEMAIPMV